MPFEAHVVKEIHGDFLEVIPRVAKLQSKITGQEPIKQEIIQIANNGLYTLTIIALNREEQECPVEDTSIGVTYDEATDSAQFKEGTPSKTDPQIWHGPQSGQFSISLRKIKK